MKKIILIIVAIVVIGVGSYFLLNRKENKIESNAPFVPAEIYAGNVQGSPLTLEFDQVGTHYLQNKNGVVTQGEVNTERGLGGDANATVYVLNWKEDKAKQQYFVRLTDKPNQIQAIDAAYAPIQGSVLLLQFKKQ